MASLTFDNKHYAHPAYTKLNSGENVCSVEELKANLAQKHLVVRCEACHRMEHPGDHAGLTSPGEPEPDETRAASVRPRLMRSVRCLLPHALSSPHGSATITPDEARVKVRKRIFACSAIVT